MREYANNIRTRASVTILYTSGPPVNVPIGDPNFHKIVELIEQQKFDEAALQADTGLKIIAHTNGKFSVEDGSVVIGGEKLPKNLSERLLQFVEAKTPTLALENFWGNLKENPSEDSKKDLFTFLEKNHFALTEDGCFIGYKWIRADFTDCHTGTILNKPGQIIKMDRGDVNPNRNDVCSTGLHVAAMRYAKTTMATGNGANGRLMEVKVNPRDVVAVPVDYNREKLRCCRYEVLRECGHKEPIKENTYEEKIEKVAKKAEVRHDKKEKRKQEKSTNTPRKFTTTMLHPDGQGRLRIPASMLEAIGAKLNAYAYVADIRSRNVMVIAKTPKGSPHAQAEYKVTPDGVIRIYSSFLAEAKIDNGSKYIAKIINDEIEIRKG